MKNQKWLAAGITAALGAAAGVLAVRTYQHFRRDLAAAAQLVLSGSKVVPTKMGSVECAVHGSGNPVLLIHGAGGGYDQGLVMARLTNLNLQAISVSRFGYLRTPMPDNPDPASQADAHAALLDELGVEKSAIMGISAGGPSALHFALRHPERCSALVLMCAVTERMPLPYGLTIDKIRFLFSSEFAGWLLTNPLRPILLTAAGVSPDVYRNLSSEERDTIDEFVRSFPPITPKLKGVLNDAMQIPELADIPYEKIQAPALIFHAADDPLVPVITTQRTAERLSNAVLFEYPHGGHLLVGNHSTISSQVESFLQDNRV